MKKEKAEKQLDDDETYLKLRLLEAALYVSGRPLNLKTLGSVIGVRSKKEVQRLARVLLKEYRNRNTSLEILELKDERFVMQLKPRYTPKVRKLARRPLLSTGPLKTLSYIAFRQPVPQSQVVDVRGSHAYRHIKELQRMGLISKEKVGKDLVLKTTQFFADYFGLSPNLSVMKRQLKKLYPEGEELKKPS